MARPDTPATWLSGPGVAGLVSVVVPVYNAERFLREAVESVWTQTWPAAGIELLVADDGSTDGSVALAEALRRESPVTMQVLRHPGHVNLGVSETRNLALAHARGQFVALLDADDAWYPPRLAEGAALLDRLPDADAVCSLGDNIDDEGRPVVGANGTTTAGEYRTVTPDHVPPFTFEQLWTAYPIANSSLLLRRAAVRQAGPYPSDMAHQAEDWLLALKVAARSPIHCIDQHLIRYRAHAASYTAQYHRLSLERGARLELLYHVVDWLLAQPDRRDQGTRLFRRHYPALLSQAAATHAAVERVLADAVGEAGLDLHAAAARLARERMELDTLRRVVPAALQRSRRRLT